MNGFLLWFLWNEIEKYKTEVFFPSFDSVVRINSNQPFEKKNSAAIKTLDKLIANLIFKTLAHRPLLFCSNGM